MRSVLVHGALALIGLALAYTTWSSAEEGGEEERPAEEVTISDCGLDRFDSVELTTKTRQVKIERKRDRGAPVYWVTTTPVGTRDNTSKRFVGGDEPLNEYMKNVAPFRALRSLGDVPRRTLKQLGLDHPDTRLDLRCGGRTSRFNVGGSTFGAGDRYARARSGGPVYLIAAATVRDAEGAEFRFMQRELHTFKLEDVDEARVESSGRNKRLLHRNRHNAEEAEWVDASEPSRRNELYGNWLDRVWRLRVQEYLAPGREPGTELHANTVRPTPVLTIEYTGDGRRKGKLELVSVAARPGTEYYGRTETTRSWVKIPRSLAQQVENDARTMLGLEPLPQRPEDRPPESTMPEEAHGGADGGMPRNPHEGIPGAPPLDARSDAGMARRSRRGADAGASAGRVARPLGRRDGSAVVRPRTTAPPPRPGH